MKPALTGKGNITGSLQELLARSTQPLPHLIVADKQRGDPAALILFWVRRAQAQLMRSAFQV